MSKAQRNTIKTALNPVEFDGIRMQTGLNSFVLPQMRILLATSSVKRLK